MYIPASSSDRMSEEFSVEVEQQLKDKLLQLAATAEQVGWLVLPMYLQTLHQSH